MTHRSRLLVSAVALLSVSTESQAQEQAAPPATQRPQSTQGQPAPAGSLPETADYEAEDDEDIVVVGRRPPGSVVGDIPPEDTFDARDVRATGATDVSELLEALTPQIGSARGRAGDRPILLLNGQRISGFREIRDIPTEAIQRVEILPEEVALKYGYRVDQRVVNIVLRRRFRSTAVRTEARVPTKGGSLSGLGDVTRLMIGKNGRTQFNLRAEGTSALTEAERDIRFEPSEGQADDRSARTLIGSRRLLRANATHSRPVLGASASLNGEIEHNEGQSLLGLPAVPEGSLGISELDPRVRNTTSDSGHLGLSFHWDKWRWRYSVNGNADLVRNLTTTDPNQFEAAFGPHRALTLRASGDLDATATGSVFTLPAGDASVTLKTGASTLHLDSSRRDDDRTTSTSLGRSQGTASFNFDLPVSRRNREFDELGNLTLNANGEVQQLSDFGTLMIVGAGANWSPVNPVNLIVSWTREEGAPTIQQLGEPILQTGAFRIFDFTRGETILASAITGGNPDLKADRRNVFKVSGNWRPLGETDLRLRAEYVRSDLENPITGFPGPSLQLEAAFPERFTRSAEGELITVDLRTVNFDKARRQIIRWGVDLTKPIRSQRPSPSQLEQLRAQWRGRRSSEGRQRGSEATPPVTGNIAPPADPGAAAESGARAGGPRGGSGGGSGWQGRGGGGGGWFGGRQGGRLTFSLTHTLNLVDEVTIRPGLPELDYLNGDALGPTGGRSRHEIEAQAGWANNGLGARLSANWKSGTEVNNATAGGLRFLPLATFNIRLFANLGERFDLVADYPWLRGTQARFEVRNLLNARPRVRDAAGDIPFGYQSDLLEPQGRVLTFSLRKLFSPRAAWRGRGQRN